KGKGFKYIRPLAQECKKHLAQECKKHCCGQRDASLLGKGKIPNMHPLSRLLLEVYPLPLNFFPDHKGSVSIIL
ncbi:hypothetical protein VF09_36040, partial [Nostoc linckia z9]